jgi:uridylate kinase
LKQSGELLTDESSMAWTPGMVGESADRIQELHQASELDVEGLMVVSGAGNLVRGDRIRAQFGEGSAVSRYGDALGRIATAQNAIVLGAALQDRGVPHKWVAAPNMGFIDSDLGVVDGYDPELVMEAYANEEVVLALGGSGESNQTTDAAVMYYTLRQAAAFPAAENVALKATKFPGIYTADPAKDPQARQYVQISAQEMLERGLGGVDDRCLNLIADAKGDADLFVYSAECTPLQALQFDNVSGCTGTIITSREVEPILLDYASL